MPSDRIGQDLTISNDSRQQHRRNWAIGWDWTRSHQIGRNRNRSDTIGLEIKGTKKIIETKINISSSTKNLGGNTWTNLNHFGNSEALPGTRVPPDVRPYLFWVYLARNHENNFALPSFQLVYFWVQKQRRKKPTENDAAPPLQTCSTFNF